MDTLNPATIEVPNFKLAKVGKDRERKRGGGGWFSGGRGAGSGFSGAIGGSGSGAGGLLGLGAFSTKMLLILAASAIVCGASWQYGRMLADNGGPKTAGAKVFSDKGGPQKYDDLSGVIKTNNDIPNSLGYVSGSTDGLTPEERAKKAAEAEAARNAEAEAARKAAEEAKKEPETPAAAPVDPKAVADAAAPKKGLTAGKFGQLGSSFGGGSGLSGGAGLSGGINRNFGAANMNAKPQNGSLGNFRNATKVASASAPHALASKSKSKGFAKRQLDNAFTQSRQAMTASRGETSATSASAPFDNNPGVGNVIAGPGVGNTAGPSNGNGNGSINPTNTGGPLGDGNGAACQSGFAPDVNGNCQAINSGNGVKAARDQKLIDMANMMLMVIAVLSAACLLFKGKAWFDAIAEAISVIIGVLGVVVMGLGVAIMASSGDKVVGGVLTLVGAFIGACAFYPTQLTSAVPAVTNMAAGEFIAAAVGMLATSALHKPQMD